jgi:D-3-phosphoglycerate dehydrogenase
VKPVILVTGADLAPQAISLLKEFELVYAGKTPDEESLVRLCREYRPVAIIVRYGKVSARIMDEAPDLKVIAKHGVGIDTIDVEAAAQRGIAVKPALGANATAVAEHTWALILACAKSLAHLNRRMQEGYWDKPTHKSIELAGRTLGLVGLGAIGERVAQIGIAFGMTVLAHDPYRETAPTGVRLCSLRDVVSAADVVSLHCPLTPENRNLFDREMLSRLRDGAILVNTARGGLIDENALIDLLRAGKIRAAGLDCFAQEPVTGAHALGAMANVICTPHIGGVTEEAYVNMGTCSARNVLVTLGG